MLVRARPPQPPLPVWEGPHLSHSVEGGQGVKVICLGRKNLRVSVHMAEQFESHEVERIRTALTDGSDPLCPRCGGRFDRTDVPPRNEVPYVRDRIWLICVTCGAGLVLDRPKALRR
jgi:hypothetical protein